MNLPEIPAPKPPTTRPTILVVDDAPAYIDILNGMLGPYYRLRVANNGLKALEIAAGQDQPDLILLDLLMPGMDGYEVLRKLKKDPRTQPIPVLIITTVGDFESERLGFELGCADYITKPFSPALVRARVNTHVQQYRLLRTEHELLEKTLKGSLAMLVEMLSILDPESFQVARRMGGLAERVGRALGMESSWTLGIAAVLSQIGVVTIPEQVLLKVRRGAILTSAEREMYNRIPEIGHRLINNIPRLEEVAEIVHHMQKNVNGTGFPDDDLAGDAIPLGSRILRVVYDYLNHMSLEGNTTAALNEMFQRTTWYDLDVLQALQKVLKERPPQKLPVEPIRKTLTELRAGQILASPVESFDGRVFIQPGTILGEIHLEKIRNISRFLELKEPILIESES